MCLSHNVGKMVTAAENVVRRPICYSADKIDELFTQDSSTESDAILHATEKGPQTPQFSSKYAFP